MCVFLLGVLCVLAWRDVTQHLRTNKLEYCILFITVSPPPPPTQMAATGASESKNYYSTGYMIINVYEG